MSKIAEVGYKGQRYKVSATRIADGAPVQIGWTEKCDGGGLRRLIIAHPSLKQPVIEDMKPELRTEPRRSDGGRVCEDCGRMYGTHPQDFSQLLDGYPYLHVICNGDYVKL